MTEKRIDIRWRDLDALGHVNQAVYQTYGEEIVDAWFRDVLGLRKGEVWDYVVVRLTTDYRSELTLADEQVAGSVRVVRAGNVERHARARAARGVRRARRRRDGGRLRLLGPEQRAARPITDDERAKLEAAA